MCTAKPKIQAPAPVIERQAYKSPVPRGSLASGDGDARRRMIAGVATSAQGVTTQASTTRKVMAGGDQQIMPVLTGGQTSPTTTPVVTNTGAGPTQGPQTNPLNPKKKGILGFIATRPAAGLVASRTPALPNVY